MTKVFALICLAAVGAGAQSNNSHSWESLSQIHAGTAVSVTTVDGRKVEGQFAAVSSDSLTIKAKKLQSAIAKPNVRRVTVAGRHAHRAQWIGLGTGAAAGAGVGALAGSGLASGSGGDFNNLKGPITVIVAGLGALIGLVVGSYFNTQAQIVYER